MSYARPLPRLRPPHPCCRPTDTRMIGNFWKMRSECFPANTSRYLYGVWTLAGATFKRTIKFWTIKIGECRSSPHISMQMFSGLGNKQSRFGPEVVVATWEIMMGEGNKQPLLCWLPLWVVELGFVAENCTNIGSLYIICQHNSSTP